MQGTSLVNFSLARGVARRRCRRLDPAKYRIYGCEEKGFTICGEAYNAFVAVAPAEAAAPRNDRDLDYFVQEFSL